MNRVAINVAEVSAEDRAAFDRQLAATQCLGARSRLCPTRVGEDLNLRRVDRLHPKFVGPGAAV